MENALGMIEIYGFSTGILVADIMAKTANVKTYNIERGQGRGWVTVKITGNVAAVTAAITAGVKLAKSYDQYIMSQIIPRPGEDVDTLFSQLAEKNDIIQPKKSTKKLPSNNENNQVDKIKSEEKTVVIQEKNSNKNKVINEKKKAKEKSTKDKSTKKTK